MRELSTRVDIPTPLDPTGPTGPTGPQDPTGPLDPLDKEGLCRLRVWVSKAAEGEDPNIFVTEIMPPRHQDEELSIRFSHIASPTDMTQYPIEEPGTGGFYYRTRGADLLFDSPAQAGDFMDKVYSHLAMLESSEAMLKGDPTKEEEIDV